MLVDEVEDGLVECLEASAHLVILVSDLVDALGGGSGAVAIAVLLDELLEVVEVGGEGRVVGEEIGEGGGGSVVVLGKGEDFVDGVAKVLGAAQIIIIALAAEAGGELGEGFAGVLEKIADGSGIRLRILAALAARRRGVGGLRGIGGVGGVGVLVVLDGGFGFGEFATQDAGVGSLENVEVGIGVEFGVERNLGINILETNIAESGDKVAKGFEAVGLHVVENVRGDVAVNHARELGRSLGKHIVLEEVLLVFDGNRGVVAVDFLPVRIAVLVMSEAHAVEEFAVDVAVVGDIGVGENILKAVAFFGAVEAAEHANPAVDSVGVVLEEGARLGSFGEAVEVGDVVLADGVDIAVVGLGGKHRSDFGGVLFVFGGEHGGSDGAVVATEEAGVVMTLIEGGSVGVADAERGEVAAVDGVTDGDIATDELLHIASFVRVNARDGIAVVVFDVKVADAAVFLALFGREAVVFVGGDFAVGLLVDANEVGPRTVLFPLYELIVDVLDGVVLVVDFEAVIADFGLVEDHGAGGGFVEAELGHNNVSFAAAASFDFGTLGDNLAEDGGFADVVSEATRGAKDEAVELVGVLVAVGAGLDVLREEVLLVGLSVVDGAELFLHDLEVSVSASIREALAGVVVEVLAVFGEGVVVGGFGGAETGAIELGLGGGTGVAIGAGAVGVVALGVATAARGGLLVGASGGAALNDGGGIFGVELAEVLAVGEIVAELGAWSGVVAQVVLAALFGVRGGPVVEATANRIG